MNLKKFKKFAFVASIVLTCSWTTSCSDDDNEDKPLVEGVDASDFIGYWEISGEDSYIVFENDFTGKAYLVEDDSYEESSFSWSYNPVNGALTTSASTIGTDAYKVSAMSTNSFSVIERAYNETLVFNRISQSQLPSYPSTSDAFTNTSWNGTVGGYTVELQFKSNNKVTEILHRGGSTYTYEGTYTYTSSTDSIILDIDGFIRNNYGSKFSVYTAYSQLTLTNTLGEELTFKKM